MKLRIDRGVTRRRLALVMVGFALLYGFFMVNFVDSTYASSGSPSSCPPPLTMQYCVAPSDNPMSSLYHVWLVALYFAPFLLISLLLPDHWEILVSLGLLASFMNDGLWGEYHMLNAGVFYLLNLVLHPSTPLVDPNTFAPWAFGPSSSFPAIYACDVSPYPAGWDWGVFWCWFDNWFGFSPRALFDVQLGKPFPVPGYLMTISLILRAAVIVWLADKWVTKLSGSGRA